MFRLSDGEVTAAVAVVCRCVARTLALSPSFTLRHVVVADNLSFQKYNAQYTHSQLYEYNTLNVKKVEHV